MDELEKFLPFCLALIFALPLQAACLNGLTSARDSNARVTLESPWVFFDRAFRKRVRWWGVIWGLLLFVDTVYYFTKTLYLYSLPTKMAIHFALIATSEVLTLWLLVFLSSFALAPRCNRPVVLAFASLLVATLFYGLVWWVSSVSTRWPGFNIRYEYLTRSGNTGTAVFPLVWFYFLGLICIVSIIYWNTIRRGGNRWFLFDGLKS